MKKTIYFVRHGQSEGNIGTVYQPTSSPLTGRGREQAGYAAERAAALSFELIVSSPIARAKETAEAIAERTGKPIEFSNLFVERQKPANLSGKAHSDIEAQKLNGDWEKSLYTSGYRAEDGENFDDLILRAVQALKHLADRPEKDLLVVTHGFFLKTMVTRILIGKTINGDSFKHFQYRVRTQNTGLSVLEFDSDLDDPSWRLLVWNDHAHLG
ncbi:MAG: histidine phosphatase family protein [Candidatus Parcubacteria bacterium]|nr:histidine phosphatase family protein [Candidatus Parcubacteria bacterium]